MKNKNEYRQFSEMLINRICNFKTDKKMFAFKILLNFPNFIKTKKLLSYRIASEIIHENRHFAIRTNIYYLYSLQWIK